MSSIAVLGAGSWGTALAFSFSRRCSVRLWCRSEQMAKQMQAKCCNEKYLPGIMFPETLQIEPDLKNCLDGARFVIVAVPSMALRTILMQLVSQLDPAQVVILATKGLESGALPLMGYQVAVQCGLELSRVAVLSGPSFAKEVAEAKLTVMVIAASTAQQAYALASKFSDAYLRVYASTDMPGVALGGALKNVFAIATGVCDGRDMGLNARAALLTRGLHEMSQLIVACGGEAQTAMGLAAAGDLLLTCTGDLSRNRRLGLLLAQGKSLEVATAQVGQVVEGVEAARQVLVLAQRYQIAMPIVQAVCHILFEDGRVDEVATSFFQRPVKPEFLGLEA